MHSVVSLGQDNMNRLKKIEREREREIERERERIRSGRVIKSEC